MPLISDVLTVGGALLAGGVAFGGVAALVKQQGDRLAKHIESDEKHAHDVIDRLARIETILTERE